MQVRRKHDGSAGRTNDVVLSERQGTRMLRTDGMGNKDLYDGLDDRIVCYPRMGSVQGRRGHGGQDADRIVAGKMMEISDRLWHSRGMRRSARAASNSVYENNLGLKKREETKPPQSAS